MRKLLAIVLAALPLITSAQIDDFEQEGRASFYADKFEGRTTASGERYKHNKATCAHLSLPFGTVVKVTNLDNQRTAVARVNDRGPFVADRIIDVSKSVAERLGMITAGTANVKIEVVTGAEAQAVNAVQPDKQPQATAAPTAAPRPQPATNPAPVANSSAWAADEETSEFFELSIKPVQGSGFAIQIASYRDQASMMRFAAKAQSLLREKIRIQTAIVKGERVYRLLIGDYSTREEATRHRPKVAKHYGDCFVVAL